MTTFQIVLLFFASIAVCAGCVVYLVWTSPEIKNGKIIRDPDPDMHDDPASSPKNERML